MQTGAPVCVGIDPVYERLPRSLRAGADSADGPDARDAADALLKFSLGVLDAVREHVPCIKIQSACFERYLWPGVEAYHKLVHEARQRGLIVIGDAKRGDIGISAAHYAAGCLADPAFADLGTMLGPDALTINAYLGPDAIKPFIDLATEQGKGLFALVRTSNPGSDTLQSAKLDDGQTVAQATARMLADLGAAPRLVGRSGYSLLGAVVGATKPDDIAALRDAMPQQILLVPGFGAQGGQAQDLKACFKPDRTGAVITASRSVIYAYEKTGGDNWQGAVESAAKQFKEQVASMLRP